MDTAYPSNFNQNNNSFVPQSQPNFVPPTNFVSNPTPFFANSDNKKRSFDNPPSSMEFSYQDQFHKKSKVNVNT